MLAQELSAMYNDDHTMTHRATLILSPPAGVPALIVNGDSEIQGIIRYARATETWVDAGASSYVVCGRASDLTGTPAAPPVTKSGVSLASTFRVYLPSGAGKDPNVRAGDVLQYVTDTSGKAVAIGGSYLDDPIGTIKMWSGLEADIRPGWELATELAGKFIVAAGGSFTAGDTGGSLMHTHEATVEEASAGVTGSGSGSGATVDSATTGISVGDHDEPSLAHDHTVLLSGAFYPAGGDNPPSFVPDGIYSTSNEGPGPLSHSVNDPGHTHDIDLSGISISIDDPGHTHGLDIEEASNLPPYYALAFIRRVL